MPEKSRTEIRLSVLALVVIALSFPKASSAVVPPDFIFNIGSQLAQFFSLAFFAIAGFFGFIFRFFRDRLPHQRRLVFLGLGLAISLLGAWSFTAWKSAGAQKEAYGKWLAESRYNSDRQANSLSAADIAANLEAASSSLAIASSSERLSLPEVIASTSSSTSFFIMNKEAKMEITNEEFQKVIDSKSDGYLVLDSREGLEHEYGYFPGSLHIRLVDLMAGRFTELPEGKVVYVMCWSGIRSRESAEFLVSKGIVARYLKDGAKGWVDSGGAWEGEINFRKKYSSPEYKVLYSTDEVRALVAEGVIMVDSRSPSAVAAKPFPGAISIPIMYTPASELEAKFALVPKKSRFVTICDDYINCFDAELVGAELEKRGHEFLGRYNRPWEYDKR